MILKVLSVDKNRFLSWQPKWLKQFVIILEVWCHRTSCCKCITNQLFVYVYDVVISFFGAAVMFFLATWRWVNVSQVSSFTLNYADDVDFCKASCHQAVFWSSMPFPHVVHQVFLLLLSQQLWVEWPSRMCFFNTCQQRDSVFVCKLHLIFCYCLLTILELSTNWIFTHDFLHTYSWQIHNCIM